MSDDLYYKVGVALEDDFFLATPASPQGQTGEAANFTFKLSKDGVVQTTASDGITLTEVSPGADGAGIYHISCDQTTSFVANTGQYSLVINWTTDPTYNFPKTYRVNSNGLPTGTFGSVSFTATASDGRITDGTNPLEGATIYIRTPGSVADYTQLTSSSLGLWGPVYFPYTGVWPLTVQLNGYTAGSGSITVTASAAGPGSDIILTAVTSGSGLSLLDLKTHARAQVRGAVGTSADTLITRSINAGLQMVAKEYKWCHLMTDGSFTTQAYYATGTIALTEDDATVTLTSGTWPSWAATGKLIYAGQVFPVASRTSGTVIELSSDYAGTTTSGVAFVLYKNEYDLPADLMTFGRIQNGTGWGWSADPVSYQTLSDFEGSNNQQSLTPIMFAIKGEASTKKICTWPYPTLKRNWPFQYYRQPALLSNNTDEADWDPLKLELLHRAIEVQLCINFGSTVHGNYDQCDKDYRSQLNKDVANDQEKGPRPGIGGNHYGTSIKDRTLPPPF